MFELPKLLITGAEGQLGYELSAQAQEQGFEVVSCSHDDLDICDWQAVAALFAELKPDYVVNAAGKTLLGLDSEACFNINFQGPEVLAQVCSDQDIALIHLSCAEVFGGDSEIPYREDDDIAPPSDYGRSIYQGEQAVRQHMCRHLILRTGWLFSARGQSSVLKLLEQARKADQVCVADGLVGSPTSAVDLSRVVTAIIKQLDCGVENWGTYHYCATETVSWFGFCETIIAAARQYEDLPLEQLVSVHQSELGSHPRATYSVLNCEQVLRDFGIHQRSWRTGLMKVVRNLYDWAE
ncbi:MAG: NAD(P)-dependent oxidoreductase [Motiliproteus sp.]|nr:NAD(P)-dependent oxidoreductase [Motiliproteus sp.]MCW9052337.1 NAD(P)-dependent oxidoreductase [Motiliproteus sp.]